MTYVKVTLQYEATHNWPGVTEHLDLAEVYFLKDEHRHIFWIRAYKEVTHDDRDVEIIKLKRDMLQYLQIQYGERCGSLGATSCEMLARDLAENFDLSQCEVTEDDENGALYVKES